MKYSELEKKANESLFIIGEAGVNHNGDVALAKELVDVAKESGCDAVKFQTWITEKVYSKTRSIKPEYQKQTTSSADTEYETIKKLELTFATFEEIKSYCEKREILFFSTPDEIDSAKFLVKLGMPLMKSASQDVTNLPFLSFLAQQKLPLIYSTGASTLPELINGAYTILEHTSDLVVMHCVSSYPAPLDQMNLNVIPVLRRLFKGPIGFSDHSTGIEAACAAVALGARVFEKHFTMDRNMEGPDHQASMDPKQLFNYTSSLRSLLKGLGDGRKRVLPVEENTRKAFRRFIVTAGDIKKGHKFTSDDFVFKKTISGIEPQSLNLLLNSVALEDILDDTPIAWNQVRFI